MNVVNKMFQQAASGEAIAYAVAVVVACATTCLRLVLLFQPFAYLASYLRLRLILLAVNRMYRNMPVDLVLVRHGQSEGNLAQRLCRQQQQNPGSLSGSNDPSSASASHSRDNAATEPGMGVWSKEFRERHNSLYRLTDKGRMQAAVAGRWIRSHVATLFDKYFTSEYVRAMETAAMLSLPSARWATEMYLRERDRGILANKPHHERHEQHPEEMRRKERDAFYWQVWHASCPWRIVLFTTAECAWGTVAGLRVIIVCHGGVIKSFRALIERVRPTESRAAISSSGAGPGGAGAAGGGGGSTTARGQLEKIHNCQIVWYSRRDPRTGSISSKYNWVKSVCPWNMNLSSNQWREIRRHVYSNEELLRSVHQVPQLVNRSLEELDAPFQSLALMPSPGLRTTRPDGAPSLLAVAAAAAAAASAPLGASPRHAASAYGPASPPGHIQQASPPRLQSDLPTPSGQEEEPGAENAAVVAEDFEELLSDDSECSDSDVDALLAQPPSLVLHGESTPPSPRDEEAPASLPRASEEEADEELEDEEAEETHRDDAVCVEREKSDSGRPAGEERPSTKATGSSTLRSGPLAASPADVSDASRRPRFLAAPASGTVHSARTARTGPGQAPEREHDGQERLRISTVPRGKREAGGGDPDSTAASPHSGGKYDADRDGQPGTPRSPLSTRRLAAPSLRRLRNPLHASAGLSTSEELLDRVAAAGNAVGLSSPHLPTLSLRDGALHSASPQMASCAAQRDRASGTAQFAATRAGAQSRQETDRRPGRLLALAEGAERTTLPPSPSLQPRAEGLHGGADEATLAFEEHQTLRRPERRRGPLRPPDHAPAPPQAAASLSGTLALSAQRQLGLADRPSSPVGVEEADPTCCVDGLGERTAGGEGAEGCDRCSDPLVASLLASPERRRLGALSASDRQLAQDEGVRGSAVARKIGGDGEGPPSLVAPKNAGESSTGPARRQGSPEILSSAADGRESRAARSGLSVLAPVPPSPSVQSGAQPQGPPATRGAPPAASGLPNGDTSVSALPGKACVPPLRGASGRGASTPPSADRSRREQQAAGRVIDSGGEPKRAKGQLTPGADSLNDVEAGGAPVPWGGACVPTPARFARSGPGATGNGLSASFPWRASEGLRQLLLLQQNQLLLHRQQETLRATSGFPSAAAGGATLEASSPQAGVSASSGLPSVGTPPPSRGGEGSAAPSVATGGAPPLAGSGAHPGAFSGGSLREFAHVQHQILQHLQNQQFLQLQLQQLLVAAVLPSVQAGLVNGPYDPACPPGPPLLSAFGVSALSRDFGGFGDMPAHAALSLRDPVCARTSDPGCRLGFGAHSSDSFAKDQRTNPYLQRNADGADIVNIPPLPVPFPPYGNNSNTTTPTAGRGPPSGAQALYTPSKSSRSSGACPGAAREGQAGGESDSVGVGGSPRLGGYATMGSAIVFEQNLLDSIGFSRDIHRIVSHERDRVVDEYQRFLAAQTQRQQGNLAGSSLEDATGLSSPRSASPVWPCAVSGYVMTSDEPLLPLPSASRSRPESRMLIAGCTGSEETDLRLQHAHSAERIDASGPAGAAEPGPGARPSEADYQRPGSGLVASQTSSASVSAASKRTSSCQESERRTVHFLEKRTSETATASWGPEGHPGAGSGRGPRSRASGADEGAGRRAGTEPATPEASRVELGADLGGVGEKVAAGTAGDPENGGVQGNGGKTALFEPVDGRRDPRAAKRKTDEGHMHGQTADSADVSRKEILAAAASRRDAGPLGSSSETLAPSVSGSSGWEKLVSTARREQDKGVSACPSSVSDGGSSVASTTRAATAAGAKLASAQACSSLTSSLRGFRPADSQAADPEDVAGNGVEGHAVVETAETAEVATQKETVDSGSEGESERDRGQARGAEEEDADDECPRGHEDELKEDWDSADSDQDCGVQRQAR
ncbi:putative phosphoglycerate mutase [Neospora caninum Liverpool]|uniref:phosphoglycerate mutase (2,3-diphosphoglycerate-dependent) n=1 Tax=Neospora caninum (strain Liverpool) TaxID=572307 RepID=F0VAH4_NEOCL|nr:putative phosphoglycerate mutase [Neospora caninum Liverpool]CBZ50663.1 putative phosphoglycerate mutase [Neospora caninum Liverpool]|eukprot:XP_003880696.1 putative phosphoglycerate mutase [Neospora caninum Liverpool]